MVRDRAERLRHVAEALDAMIAETDAMSADLLSYFLVMAQMEVLEEIERAPARLQGDA